MSAKRVLVLVGILVLAGCDRNDPVQPSLVADLVSDVTPPTLTAFDYSPQSINTSDADVSVGVNYTVTDEMSGATFVRVIFVNPSGNNFYILGQDFFNPEPLRTGSLSVSFPQYSETGTWTVYDVVLQDAAGNRRDLSTADLVAMGFPTTISVYSSAEDVTPPILTALSLWPATISTSDGPHTVTVTYSLTDDLSGAWLIYGLFCPPQGASDLFPYAQDGFVQTLYRTGSIQFTFPQSSTVGTWTLCEIHVRDWTKNDRVYSSEDLGALGFPTTVSVVNVYPVSIDVQPGSSLNPIKLSKQGKVAVAVLSNAGLAAASQIDRTSLTFGHTGNEQSLAACAKEGEDVNGDGLPDLVCQFYVQRTGFQVGDVEGLLRGRTADQVAIEGRDAVRILK